jgi:3'-phosphoadenosine 5'-phosphosulfate sulfotransferase (PAPS reductase)/FAD synthetase
MELQEQGVKVLKEQLQRFPLILLSWSGGKDSSVILNLTLAAALELKKAGIVPPPIVVTHADTLLENPEMGNYVEIEKQKILDFAKQNSLDVQVHTSTPHLNSQWAVRVLSGRALPVFPSSGNGGNRDCTIDYKIQPMNRLRSQILKKHKLDKQDVLTIIGTRFDESVVRSKKMTERQEDDKAPWVNKKTQELQLSPIARWKTTDIWEYLDQCKSGEEQAYSDFTDLFRLYQDGSEAQKNLGIQDEMPVYTARYGCLVCTAGKDKCMTNLVSNDPSRYGYLGNLLKLQKFIIDTQYDLDRRNWVGRTIKDGYITVTPDSYSPNMLKELLMYTLTIDCIEKQRASDQGIAPRFELVSMEALIAIDATWSLQGFHRPFTALALYDQVYNQHARYNIPETTKVPQKKMPPKKYFLIGEDWDEGHEWEYTGLRDVTLELVGDCVGTKRLNNGKTVMNVNTDLAFSVDPEGMFLFLDFELPNILAQYHDGYFDSFSKTHGYHKYLQLGFLQLAKGKEFLADKIMRRTAFKERHGLAGQIENLDELLENSLSAKELKEHLAKKNEKASAMLYSSAFDNISEIQGLILAKRPLAVSVHQLNFESSTYDLMIEHALSGGHILVDSQSSMENEEIDFDDVISRYSKVVEDTQGHVTIVAPNRIGQQQETFNLIEDHMFSLRRLMDVNATVLIPLQKGIKTPYEAFCMSMDILGVESLGVALHSNEQGFSEEDLRNLLSGVLKPTHIHFLSEKTEDLQLDSLKDIVQQTSPETVITVDDGKRFVGKSPVNAPLVEEQQNISIIDVQGPVEEESLLETLNSLSEDQIKDFFQQITPWDCKFSPETLAYLYNRDGAESRLLSSALGTEWYKGNALDSEAQASLKEIDAETDVEIFSLG